MLWLYVLLIPLLVLLHDLPLIVSCLKTDQSLGHEQYLKLCVLVRELTFDWYFFWKTNDLLKKIKFTLCFTLCILVGLSYTFAILPISISLVFGLTGAFAGQLAILIFPAIFYIIIVDNPRINRPLDINTSINTKSEKSDEVIDFCCS